MKFRYQKISLLNILIILLLAYQNCSDTEFGEKDPQPFLNANVATTPEDTPADFQLVGEIGNPLFSIPGMDAVGLKTEHGFVSNLDPATGSFHYQPDANYNGPDRFTYVLTGGGGRFENIFQIDVTPVNDLPQVRDLVVQIQAGQPKSFNLPWLQDMWAAEDQNPNFRIDIEDEADEMRLNLKGFQVNPGHTFPDEGRIVRDSSIQLTYFQDPQALGVYTHTFEVVDRDGGKSEFRITFELPSPLLDFEPALAVANPSCLFCHANVQGNIISEFKSHLSPSSNEVNLVEGSTSRYFVGWPHGTRIAPGSSFVDGKFFVPNKNLDTETRNYISNTLKNAYFIPNDQGSRRDINLLDIYNLVIDERGSPTPEVNGFNNNPNVVPYRISQNQNLFSLTTIADFVELSFNDRTPQYVNVLSSNNAYPRRVADNTNVEIIRQIQIKAPTVAQLRTAFKVDSSVKKKFIGQGDQALNNSASAIVERSGYFENNGTLECDGDLYINGILYLSDFKVRTNTGCRIYVTKSIFVYGNPNDTNAKAINIFDPNPNDRIDAHLQMTSSSAIVLGVGADRLRGNRKTDMENGVGFFASQLDQDVNALDGKEDLSGAGSRGGRARDLKFEKVLLNAPLVTTRYRGDVSGVIITEFIFPSLGRFSYMYDPTFSRVPILPKLPPDSFFNVRR